jgi:hypothetical protein
VADIAKLSVGREAYYTRELATDQETLLEPTQPGWQRRLWSDLPAPWNPTAADPELLPPIQ